MTHCKYCKSDIPERFYRSHMDNYHFSFHELIRYRPFKYILIALLLYNIYWLSSLFFG